MIPPYTGRCLCGEVRYRCNAAPLWQAHCHCESCRRATSSAFSSFFAVSDGQWRWTAAAPATFASSPAVQRSFCARCGSQMGYRHESLPDEMHFYAATLDAPEDFAPTKHDFWEERMPWLRLTDDLERE